MPETFDFPQDPMPPFPFLFEQLEIAMEEEHRNLIEAFEVQIVSKSGLCGLDEYELAITTLERFKISKLLSLLLKLGRDFGQGNQEHLDRITMEIRKYNSGEPILDSGYCNVASRLLP
jgi:hypothetical protein